MDAHWYDLITHDLLDNFNCFHSTKTFSSDKSTNKVAIRDLPKIIMMLRTFSSPPMYVSSNELNTLQMDPLENVNLCWSYTF